MTILIQQLASCWKACADLDAIGVRVLSVRCSPMLAEPRVHVDDPDHLLDHLDGQSVDTQHVRYAERSVRIEGCYVFWLPGMQAAAAETETTREPWPLPGRVS